MAKREHYIPINEAKYSGRRPIVLKSSWERVFASVYCDNNPACLDWAYEPWKIPYRDPVRNRQSIYIPDFLMSFKGNNGTIRTALVEIKPSHQALQEHARNIKDAADVARNIAKWEAARAWCERRGKVDFVVLTERELFAGGQNIKARKRQVKPYGQRRVKK
jgi:TnsA endonuclease N terminal